MAYQGNNNQGGGNPRFANYRSVADRIDEFWKEMRATKTPARITSDLLHADERSVSFRSEVWAHLQGEWVMLANGYAEDMRASAPGGKCMEVAETSAIGRALANAGYTASKERASRDEMESYYAAQEAEEREQGATPQPEPTPIVAPKRTRQAKIEVAPVEPAATPVVDRAVEAIVGEAAKQATITASTPVEPAAAPVGDEATRVFPNDKKEAARLAKMPPPFRTFIEKMWQYVEGDGESFEQIKERFSRAKPRMSEAEAKEARHQLALLKTRIEEIEASAPPAGLAEDVATELADLTAEELAFMAAS